MISDEIDCVLNVNVSDGELNFYGEKPLELCCLIGSTTSGYFFCGVDIDDTIFWLHH